MLNINTHVGQVKEGKGEAKEKIGPDGRDGSNISTHCRTGEGGSRWQPLLLGLVLTWRHSFVRHGRHGTPGALS